jgi:hypothetical protein
MGEVLAGGGAGTGVAVGGGAVRWVSRRWWSGAVVEVSVGMGVAVGSGVLGGYRWEWEEVRVGVATGGGMGVAVRLGKEGAELGEGET